MCKYCKRVLAIDSFEVCRVVDGKAYRRRRCKGCKRQVTNKRRTGLRQWLDDFKRELHCIKCGFQDYRALEFHHPGRQDKDANVADMIRSGNSKEAILREMGKCFVYCANCHRIEHYEERHGKAEDEAAGSAAPLMEE
ncbi:MAG: hypothetical protein K2W96_02085 [Gemmataceae bacterium]|nr:hypothetical protein [Gemmataceae bacterium]